MFQYSSQFSGNAKLVLGARSAWTMAFAGLYLPNGSGGSGAAGAPLGGMNHGDLLTIGAAIVFAFHIIFMGHATQKHRWQQITVVQTATAAVLMILAFPLFEEVHVVWSANVISGNSDHGSLQFSGGVFGAGLGATVHASDAHRTDLSLEPVFAWLTSFVVLGERLGMRGDRRSADSAGVVVSEEKGTAESMAVAPDHAAVPQGGEF